ncbi:MAG: PfkB family carbohydrate kinase [Patescibacteria group bacterium]
MIIVTGTIAYDYILPNQTHNINLSFIVNKFARRRGGTAGNVSYSLGLLKIPHILFSVAGKDFGEYKRAFKRLDISTDHVLVDKTNYTATGFAMTDKKDNQIWGYFYGAAERIPELRLKKIASKKDLVLIGPSGAKGSMSFVKQCVDLAIPYMFDPGFILTQVNNNDLKFGVSHAKYIVGNDYEISMIKSRIRDWGKLFKGKIIITTLGEKGSKIESKGLVYKIKSAKLKKVVDPTGAGDAYRAGFLAGLDRGFDVKRFIPCSTRQIKNRMGIPTNACSSFY